MQRFHVKRGDPVVVISGSHKGKEGKILEILPAKDRARVEGVAMIKRHTQEVPGAPPGRHRRARGLRPHLQPDAQVGLRPEQAQEGGIT